MKLKLILLGCFLIFIFILAEQRIFEINGINPNWLLIFLMAIIFNSEEKMIGFGLSATLIIFALIMAPFWFIKISLISIFAVSAYFFKKFLTGNDLINFIIAVVMALSPYC